MPTLHLNGFGGPRDLLVDLAERQRINLGRISVVVLVEQFLADGHALEVQPSRLTNLLTCTEHKIRT